MNTALEKTIFSSPIIRIFLTISIWTVLLALLPSTPFMYYLQQLDDLPYLSYLNWFVPVGRCLTIMTVWWTAVVCYYGISWILRQLAIVGR